MSTQNRYNISFCTKTYKDWNEYDIEDWKDSIVCSGDSWQEAIIDKWLEREQGFEVRSETPSADSRSGILDIKEEWPRERTERMPSHYVHPYVVFWKIKATIID